MSKKMTEAEMEEYERGIDRLFAVQNEILKSKVEQAFRDGLAYGSNVANADPDIAWEHSRARWELYS